ncbi:MAG: hypothetical protein LUE21_09380 [Oscillospiraceae bacterium]|nr:hypothetical protein [Oscillospiraceae bacterium]
MKRKKNILTAILLLLIAAALLPFAVLADETEADTTEPTATAEPTATVEPTATPEPTATTAPTETPEATATATPTEVPESTAVVTSGVVTLSIDDENIYEGMDKAYKDGYVPQVADGMVTVVLPLIASGALQSDQLTVTPSLGDTSSTPIVYKNYQKTFYLADNPVNPDSDGNATGTVSSYLVSFQMELDEDRQNGTYPVTLDVSAQTEDGTEVTASFTCYITITDGTSDNDSSDTAVSYSSGTSSTVEFQPKVLISRYSTDPATVPAGEEFTVTVTLRNTSDTQDVQNMVVSVSCSSDNFLLKNDSSDIYIDELKAGETIDVPITYATDLETAAQRYAITLSMQYDNSSGSTLSSTGTVTVTVVQVPEVELSPFTLDESLNAGDTVQLAFQVMNLGRCPVYNVRLELDVPGLSAVGTAFIGIMEAGTSADTSVNVFVGMKDIEEGQDASERYGDTSGVVRLIYEDAAGEEYTQEIEVSTSIQALTITAADTADEEEDEARAVQWWVFVLAGAAVIAVLAVLLVRRRIRR